MCDGEDSKEWLLSVAAGSPLWLLLKESPSQYLVAFSQLWSSLRSGQGAAAASSLAASPRSTSVQLSSSMVAQTLTVEKGDVWALYLPLCLLLFKTRAENERGKGGGKRLLVGICGPAAAGKTTLTGLLSVVGDKLHAVMANRPTSSPSSLSAAPTAAVDDFDVSSRTAAASAVACVESAEVQSNSSSNSSNNNDGSNSSNSGGSSSSSSSAFFQISMDAYHRTNADLEDRGLRAVKGRPETINAVKFAADLKKVRQQAEEAIEGRENATLTGHTLQDPGLMPLLLPEYDRASSHDPVEAANALYPPPRHSIVLVEGLYLCRGRGGVRGGVPETENDAAWLDVRQSLDLVIFLQLPLAVCRRRAVERKLACHSGMTAEAAAEWFDCVDAPIYAELSSASRRPCPPPALLSSQRSGYELVLCSEGSKLDHSRPSREGVDERSEIGSPSGIECGPDLIISFSFSHQEVAASAAFGDSATPNARATAMTGVSRQDSRITVDSISVNCGSAESVSWASSRSDAATISTALLTAQSASTEKTIFHVLGLNPSYQRSLIFGMHSSAMTSAPSSSAAAVAVASSGGSAWKRGAVNRATKVVESVGGKGQHFMIALARSYAFDTYRASSLLAQQETTLASGGGGEDSSLLTNDVAHLFQFIGGETGRSIVSKLESQLSSLEIKQATPSEEAAGHLSLSKILRSRLHSMNVRGDAPTRTCNTLLDFTKGDMTELIDPAAPVSAEDLALFWAERDKAISGVSERPHSSVGADRLPLEPHFLAIMGSAPAGADGVYETLLQRIADERSGRIPVTAGGYSNSSASSDSSLHAPPLPFKCFVMLDIPKATIPLLAGGSVDLLKINADELREVVEKYLQQRSATSSAKSVDHPDDLTACSIDEVAVIFYKCLDAIYSSVALSSSSSTSTPRESRPFPILAITDGPKAAYLFSASYTKLVDSGTRTDAKEDAHAKTTHCIIFQQTTFQLSPLEASELMNPIGAGDTVAAVLMHGIRRGRPLVEAFARALAAAAASCRTLIGAEWTLEPEEDAFRDIRVSRRYSIAHV